MKKFITIFLMFVLLFSTLTACRDSSQDNAENTTNYETTEPTKEPKTDVVDIWDGTIATSFEKGNGTEDSPYEIAKASQLAFLAQEINSGKNYDGKYFSLNCDIDLNNIEWTPIGNGEFPFEGNFNGNNFTISNLKISKPTEFIFKFGQIQSTGGLAGLFGFCGSMNLCDVNICNASISLDDLEKYSTLSVGTLVGRIESTTSVKMNGIKIHNSNVVMKTESVRSASIGGIAGTIKAQGDAHCSLKKIQCTDVSILYGNTIFLNCDIGGLIGAITTEGYLEISDFASYLTTEIPYYRQGVYYFGTFGDLFTNKNGQIDLSNGFSKLNINQKEQFKYGYSDYVAEWYPISGYLSTLITTPSYNFNNLFGFVVEVDATTNEQQIFTQLYIPDAPSLYTENNCKECESLPENHGFNADIWNLSDLSTPKLK